MLNATDDALKHLATLLDERDAPDGTVVRCMMEDGALALVPDQEQPGDTVFKLEERPVLVVDEELSTALEGREFAMESGENGTDLTLR